MSHDHLNPQNQSPHEPSHALSASGFDSGETGQLMAAPAFQLKAGTADTPPVQRKGSNNGLGSDLVNGFAASTGHDLSDVNVHRNSDKPSQVGALAYAQGNDIHLGPGQEKHLPHEASHIVQQREGQVKPTTEVNGMPVNDDHGLESAADKMGEQATQMKAASNVSAKKGPSSPAAAQMKVIQRKAVETNFGKFKTDKFEPHADNGVEIILKFDPDPKKVNATKIGLSQSYVGENKDGSKTGVDPTTESRRVKEGEGKDNILDRLSHETNPIYGAENQPEGQGLEDTPKSDYSKFAGGKKKLGDGGTKYQLGWAYKKGLFHKKKEAGLYDRPEGGQETHFETTALAIEGEDQGKYLGSVKWGYDKSDGNLKVHDISSASMGDPTVGFVEAAKAWNESTARGTLEVIADPAKAWSGKEGERVELPKGTKGKQIKTAEIEGVNVALIEIVTSAEHLNDLEFYVAVSDLKDLGDGKSTVDLPIPQREQ